MAEKKYAPKIPFQLDGDNKFVYLTVFIDNIKQKIKTLLLTNPGEKLMNPNFGVGIRRLLFENQNMTGNNYKIDIYRTIANQISMFIPEVEVTNVNIIPEQNSLSISIDFRYKNYYTDTFNMSLGS
jgi:hypothetical protein